MKKVSLVSVRQRDDESGNISLLRRKRYGMVEFTPKGMLARWVWVLDLPSQARVWCGVSIYLHFEVDGFSSRCPEVVCCVHLCVL